MVTDYAAAEKDSEIRRVEERLIIQCAPLFLKLRISALFMAEEEELKSLVRVCSSMRITARTLGKVEDKWGVLLYHKSLLMEYFKDENVQEILKESGYENTDLMSVLSEFSVRYQEYGDLREEFPHEMGLILGYPVEDVKGYIDNNGENSLYTGCWKVYRNLPEKIKLFKKFERVRYIMARMSDKGLGLAEIVHFLYRKNLPV